MVQVGIQILKGVQAAHAHGIIHRDIKPANLFLTDLGYTKLLDFGLGKWIHKSDKKREPASITDPGVLVGTYGYMSPEQALGRPVDERSDLFSLGVVLYEMATGRQPSDAPTGTATIGQSIPGEPVPIPDGEPVSRSLKQILQKALQVDPRGRYQSAEDFLVDLQKSNRPSGKEERRGFLADLPFPGFLRTAKRVVSGAIGREAPQSGASSIAILPFLNMSTEPANEYLGEGLAEELTHWLATIPRLGIASTTSSSRFKGRSTDIREIGRDLGVTHVLEGTVRQSGTRLRITVQLTKVSDGFHLWSQRYDRTQENLLQIQEEIASSVAANLRARLAQGQALRTRGTARPRQRDIRVSGRAGTSGPRPRHSSNAEAYRLYLRGRFNWKARYPQGWREALYCFRGAVAEDHDYALAHAALAEAYSWAGREVLIAPKDAFWQARLAAERSLSLDPGLAEAHIASALVKSWSTNNQEAASQEFRRGIELGPVNAMARIYHAWSLALPDRNRAITAIEEALQLDPSSADLQAGAGVTCYLLGDYDSTLEYVHDALAMDPNLPLGLWVAGFTFAHKGMFEECVEAFERAASLTDSSPGLAYLGYGYGVAGRKQDTQEIRQQLQQKARKEYVSPLCWICVAIGLEDREETLTWLGRCCREGVSPLQLRATIGPNLEKLAPDPLAQKLLGRLGLCGPKKRSFRPRVG